MRLRVCTDLGGGGVKTLARALLLGLAALVAAAATLVLAQPANAQGDGAGSVDGRIVVRPWVDDEGNLTRVEFGFRPGWGEDVRGGGDGPDDLFPPKRFLTQRLIDGSAGRWLRSSEILIPDADGSEEGVRGRILVRAEADDDGNLTRIEFGFRPAWGEDIRGTESGTDDIFPTNRFLTRRLIDNSAGKWLRSSLIAVPAERPEEPAEPSEGEVGEVSVNGGTATAEDGATITVPPGAAAVGAKITARVIADEELPPLPGRAAERLGAWDFEVEGELTGTVTLSLPLPADEDETWFLGHYDGERWYLEPFTVEGDRIIVQTNSLSLWEEIKGIPVVGDVAQGLEDGGKYFVEGVKVIGEGVWDGITWSVDWGLEKLGLKDPIVCEKPEDTVTVENPSGGNLIDQIVGVYLKGCAQRTDDGPLLLARNPRHIWFEVRPVEGNPEHATPLDIYKWLSGHDEGTLLAPGAVGSWRPTRDGTVRLNAEMTWTAVIMTVFYQPIKEMIEEVVGFAVPIPALTNLVSVLLRSDDLVQAFNQWDNGNREAALKTVAGVLLTPEMGEALVDLMIAAAQHAGVTIKKAALVKLYAAYKVGEKFVNEVQRGVEFFKVLIANDEERLGTVAYAVPPSVCWGGDVAEGTVNGRWNHACQSQRLDGSYARYYRFELDEAQEVTLALNSELRSAVYVSPEVTRTAKPVRVLTDASDWARAEMEAGTYTIEVATRSPRRTGTFDLRVELGGAGEDEPDDEEPDVLPPIGDGSLMVLAGTSDLYQAHVVGGSLFKRLILNPAVFDGYGFQLGAVRSVEQAEFDRWATTDLARLGDDAPVWRLFPDGGVRRLLDITPEQFEAAGFDWDAVISINQTEFDEWREGSPITAAELGLEDAEDDGRPAVGTIRVVEPLVEVPTGGGADASQAGVFIAVSAGQEETCGLRASGAIVCWGGYNAYGQLNTPTGRFTTAGIGFCALRLDGTIECWGNWDGRLVAPGGVFSAFTVGTGYMCGLRPSGAIECWGNSFHGETNAPAGSFSAVSAGALHVCGLRTSGAVECWGRNNAGQRDAPSGTFSAVSASSDYTCGLRTSGAVECWGDNAQGQTDAPSGTFSAVSAGGAHSCGLRTSGAVECWGWNPYGQTNAPTGHFSAVSAGTWHTCGLRPSGAIECWGRNYVGQTDVPSIGVLPVSAAPIAQTNPIIQYVQVFTGERWIGYNCVGRDTNSDGSADLFFTDAAGNLLPNAAGINDACVKHGWASRPLPDDSIVSGNVNEPPQCSDIADAGPLSPGEASRRIPLSDYCRDPEGESLRYEVASSDEGVATASISGGSLIVAAARASGTATITLTASDPDGLTARTSFRVTVRERAPEPPEISITCPEYAETGHSFSCMVRNRGGAATSWDWSASGGAVGGRSETYSVRIGWFGRHIVRLTASNAGGSDSDSATVHLVAAPPHSQYGRCGSDTIKVYWFDRRNFRKHHVNLTGEEATRILGPDWWATIGHLSQPACDSWPTGAPVTAENYR